MRVLLINSVYKNGSTGKIVYAIGATLRNQGHDVFTLYGLGDAQYDNYSKRVCTGLEHNWNALWSRISGIPFGGLFYSNKKIERYIEKCQPDVVHVHCVNASTMNVYHLFKYLGGHRIKTILTLHAEIFHTGGCDHAYECEKWKTECHDCTVYKQKIGSWFFDRSADSFRKMKEAISHFYPDNLIITAVSPWLADRARQSEILKGFRIEYVPNGVDTTIFHFKESQGIIERRSYDRVVLHVTPSFRLAEDDIKGGRFLPIIAKDIPDTLFIVVATNSSVTQEQLPSNILLWGRAKSQEELAQLYSEADLTLLLSKRETFSMVTVESLCCGTPVVGFKAGGPESIALDDYCQFVDYGNISMIKDSLYRIKKKDRKLSEIAQTAYNMENMAEGYVNEYSKLIQV